MANEYGIDATPEQKAAAAQDVLSGGTTTQAGAQMVGAARRTAEAAARAPAALRAAQQAGNRLRAAQAARGLAAARGAGIATGGGMSVGGGSLGLQLGAQQAAADTEAAKEISAAEVMAAQAEGQAAETAYTVGQGVQDRFSANVERLNTTLADMVGARPSAYVPWFQAEISGLNLNDPADKKTAEYLMGRYLGMQGAGFGAIQADPNKAKFLVERYGAAGLGKIGESGKERVVAHITSDFPEAEYRQWLASQGMSHPVGAV